MIGGWRRSGTSVGLRLATWTCFLLGSVALLLPPSFAIWTGWVVIGILVAAPITRVLRIAQVWWRAGDRRFAGFAAAIPVVILAGAVLVGL